MMLVLTKLRMTENKSFTKLVDIIEALYGQTLETLTVENLDLKRQLDLACYTLGASQESKFEFFDKLIESVKDKTQEK